MFGSNWNKSVNSERVELVFANRNRAFGAYVIRKGYERTMLLAFAAGFSLIFLVVLTPTIMAWIEGLTAELNKPKVKITQEVQLVEAPPIDKNEPPPPPVVPPPPLQETVKFTPPKVVKDEEVPQDEPPPTQDQLKETNAGLTTQEGDPNLVDVPPDDAAAVGDTLETTTNVFTIVEQMPSFPGGELELRKYLGQNTRYPTIAKENDIQGKVYVSFVVERNGSITDVVVVRDIGGGCGAEAARVVKSMPSWIPGKQNGKAVRVKYMVPVNFVLQN